jgi:glucose-6-phosphate dehydrogenase assembly protein OpcA
MNDRRSAPDRRRWRGEGVRVERIVAELDRLHRIHQSEGGGHALTRTLNLIVAPGLTSARADVDAVLAGLGAHSPSRTLILRRHDVDRLDAEASLECRMFDAAGRVGVCHDQVVLSADPGRLAHAGSLVAPLLMADLPTVLWITEPGASLPDPGLLERSQQVLVNSGDGDTSLRWVVKLAAGARVHDLAWGRLEFWRAAIAAAFERPERLDMLPRITGLEVVYGDESFSAALLLVGWIAARAGWRPAAVDRENGDGSGTASRADGAAVNLSLARDPRARGCGGIESITLRAGDDQVRVERGAATSRWRDLFAEALQPLPSYGRGYVEALSAAAVLEG